MSSARAIERLLGALPQRCAEQVPLASLCTWRIGGPADLLLKPDNEAELALALGILGEESASWWMVGAGSNLLFPDEGLRGVVLRLGAGFAGLDLESPLVTAGAALNATTLCRTVAEAGLAGLEFAGGIPGSVGGMVRMNAGAHGQDVAQTLSRVRVMERDGQACWLAAAELGLVYRSCSLLADRLVLAAQFTLREDRPEEILQRMRAMLDARRSSQPLREATCGSVFKRPGGDFPGRLIEDAGLKGARMGAAVVSSLHANFFINEGGATARDMLALVDHVKRTVKERFGVELEEEFRHVQ